MSDLSRWARTAQKKQNGSLQKLNVSTKAGSESPPCSPPGLVCRDVSDADPGAAQGYGGLCSRACPGQGILKTVLCFAVNLIFSGNV